MMPSEYPMHAVVFLVRMLFDNLFNFVPSVRTKSKCVQSQMAVQRPVSQRNDYNCSVQ